MAMQSNRSLTSSAPSRGGLLSRLGAWLGTTQPRGGTPPVASEPSVSALLDRLALSGKGASALTNPRALQTFLALSTPGQAASIQPAGWQALAQDWAKLSAPARLKLAGQLQLAGVKVDAGADGRYISFLASGLRVIAEPSSNRIRRTQGDTVLGYEGDRLAVAMKLKGDQIEVTTAEGVETWVAGLGQGTADSGAVQPRLAAEIPFESPRVALSREPRNKLKEPNWGANTRMEDYAPDYDAAIQAMGGTVEEPANAKARPADMYNCHAFATTGAQGDLFDPFLRESHPHWLNNPMYRLTHGPFAQVPETQRVHPGDVIVYRTAEGKVTHTGIVREVDARGNPTLVASKFGVLGLYVHGPYDVPAQYGGPAEYFRPDSP